MAWLQKLKLGDVIFADIEEMGCERAYCQVCNGLAVVPDCEMLAFGFSCKDLSALSANRVTMMGIIRAAVEKFLVDINAPVPPKTELPGTTARTLLGGLKYVARHMPPWSSWNM